jgi:hypothetical protein
LAENHPELIGPHIDRIVALFAGQMGVGIVSLFCSLIAKIGLPAEQFLPRIAESIPASGDTGELLNIVHTLLQMAENRPDLIAGVAGTMAVRFAQLLDKSQARLPEETQEAVRAFIQVVNPDLLPPNPGD